MFRHIPCQSSFPALECLFQSWKWIFQEWERLFQALEQRIIRGLFFFSSFRETFLFIRSNFFINDYRRTDRLCRYRYSRRLVRAYHKDTTICHTPGDKSPYCPASSASHNCQPVHPCCGAGCPPGGRCRDARCPAPES